MRQKNFRVFFESSVSRFQTTTAEAKNPRLDSNTSNLSKVEDQSGPHSWLLSSLAKVVYLSLLVHTRRYGNSDQPGSQNKKNSNGFGFSSIRPLQLTIFRPQPTILNCPNHPPTTFPTMPRTARSYDSAFASDADEQPKKASSICELSSFEKLNSGQTKGGKSDASCGDSSSGTSSSSSDKSSTLSSIQASNKNRLSLGGAGRHTKRLVDMKKH